jgi:hypothetical protein
MEVIHDSRFTVYHTVEHMFVRKPGVECPVCEREFRGLWAKES